MYLKKVILKNFKKFQDMEFEFEKGTNIIIGHNESGKSTLLKAIDIALNQSGNGDWSNRSEYGTLMNISALEKFKNSEKSFTDLPAILIELYFENDGGVNNIHNSLFYGTNNSKTEAEYGIQFKYNFDDNLSKEYNDFLYTLRSKKNNSDVDQIRFIPYEFYRASWNGFSGQSYNFRKNPFKSILIDNDKIRGNSYKIFAHQIFNSLDLKEQHALSLKLKEYINRFNNDISASQKQRFTIDTTRLVVQDILDVFDDSDNSKLLMRDMGSGKENILKTDLAVHSKNSTLILLEEPENHLSFDLARKQISKIKNIEENDVQIIVSTHSPLLASKLKVNNLRWLNEDGKIISFNNVPKDDVQFFLKADNIDILQIILAKKVILVEGATEYIAMPDMIEESCNNQTSDQLGFHVVSMGGSFYKRFKEIAKVTKNKVLVITDNDGSEERIAEANSSETDSFKVAIPSNTDDFTFEVALYNENKKFFKSKEWGHKSNINTWNKHENLDSELVWLLNNKAEAAFQYSKYFKKGKLHVPCYIEEGLKWLQK